MFKLIVTRYGNEIEFEYDTLYEALESAWGQGDNGDSYALDLFDDSALLATNRDGSPLHANSTPLNDMVDKWANDNLTRNHKLQR